MRITRKTWLSASDRNCFVSLPPANTRMWKSPLKLHVSLHVFVVMSRPGGKSKETPVAGGNAQFSKKALGNTPNTDTQGRFRPLTGTH